MGQGFITRKGGTLKDLNQGYTPLAYIESTGTQYIDTGVIGKTGLKAHLKVKLSDVQQQCIIGSAGSSGSGRIYLLHFSGETGLFAYGYGSSVVKSSVLLEADTLYEVETELLSGQQILTVNGEQLVTGTDTTTYNNGYNLWLFACNTANTIGNQAKAKLYSCKIYDNDVLVRDFIPVLDREGTPCLYDKVNRKFYYNAGTGNFHYCVPVELPEGYTQVDYIEGSGTQYIDTGVFPNQDARVVAEMSYVTHTDATCGLFGSDTKFEAFYYKGEYRFQCNNVNVAISGEVPTGKRMLIDFSKEKATYTIDGTIIDVTPSEVNDFTLTRTIYIHALNRSSTNYTSVSRTYSFKIYDNGVLVRDLVPCVDASETAGLYDLVNDVFYENVGTGTFAVGDVVEAIVA